VDAVTSGLTVDDRHAAQEGSHAGGPLPPEAASHQVVVGDIPLEPPGFLPRADLLAKLDRAGIRVAVIHAARGLRGVGATQLAAAYARARLLAGWRLVAWVNGAEAGSLQAGLAAVADAMGLTDGDSGRAIADAAQAVRQELEADGDRCLLVFDDVVDPELVRPFVPADGAARVLVTSTRQSAASLGTDLPLDVFGAAEASEYLVARTGLDDEAWAAEVAAVLGHLPLALALAAPVIRGHRHGYARYLDQLQTIPTGVSLTGNDGQQVSPDVARSVLLSLAAVRAADQTGLCTRVIEIMATLSAAGVRRELLHVAGRAGLLAGGGRRVAADLVDRALDWLSGRSLLTFSLDGQTVMMHGLVAQVVRTALVRRRHLEAVCWVAASVLEAHAIAVAGSQDRLAVRSIPQQVAALLDTTAEVSGEADEELAGKLLRLRFIALYHLVELGDSAPQAIAIGEPLTAEFEQLLGPDHPDTLNSRNSLAAAYLAADRVSDAIPLFERTLAVLQHQLGPDHPDTLTSQNNLASAYQDAGRLGEAIQLYERNLAIRERLLGVDDAGTLNSRGNLAAAYLAAGRVTEAIPLLEQTLADRERVLGPHHLDTQTSRKNLAKAYQDAGRAAEAIPLLEQTLASRPRVLRPDRRRTQISPENLAPARQDGARLATPPGEQASVHSKSFRRPPTEPARRVLPDGFRRPPAEPARRVFPGSVTGQPGKLTHHSSARRTQDQPAIDLAFDRTVVAAITAGDRWGIAMAYDRYAAALYGYCHWTLRDSADAAASLQDTFVIAATLSDLSEPSKLRPWLFALARNQCRHRIRPMSATRDEETNAADQRADTVVGRTADGLTDATMPFRAVGQLAETTMTFRAVGQLAEKTMTFRAVGQPAETTMTFRAVGPLADATMSFRVVGASADAMDGIAHDDGYLGQGELRALIRSILADLKPREREVIQLSFRHELHDSDLAVALGVSPNRAQALANRARGRLEKSFGTMRTALAGREACPVVGELLADWDGQLTEQTRDLVAWHIEQCQLCANHGRSTLRPTALYGLLPLAPLPPELREQVLRRCFSTDEGAVAYRRRVVRRAESSWFVPLSQAIRRLNWASIRANPGPAVATTAVALWVAAAVSVLLLTFAGSHVARAQAPQPTGSHAVQSPAPGQSVGTYRYGPTTAAATTNVPVFSSARPSPTVSQPSAYASPVQPSPSPSRSPSPSLSPSPSRSPSPSLSPSPSRSPSPSPSASKSPSPSPSATV
jgi:RNA polymerase sigma factor (sigma-70 family)